MKENEITDWQKYTVLIVEDEFSNFKLLEGILLRTKIKLMHAPDGIKALELFNQNQNIDIILMDIKLPKMNGIDVTKKIREKNPLIPIIAQTAFAMKHEKQNIMDAGCNNYITKPIDRKLLISMMSEYLV